MHHEMLITTDTIIIHIILHNYLQCQILQSFLWRTDGECAALHTVVKMWSEGDCWQSPLLPIWYNSREHQYSRQLLAARLMQVESWYHQHDHCHWRDEPGQFDPELHTNESSEIDLVVYSHILWWYIFVHIITNKNVVRLWWSSFFPLASWLLPRLCIVRIAVMCVVEAPRLLRWPYTCIKCMKAYVIILHNICTIIYNVYIHYKTMDSTVYRHNSPSLKHVQHTR